MDFGGPAPPRAADGLFLGPPFPPAAARWTLIEVLSIERVSFGTVSTSASNTPSHSPRLLQRWNRL